MARTISRAEAWEKAHEVFTQINFNAFDYNSIKESLLDYTKLYFPEDFNDYIESSEFVAILELFAYVGELLAYRLDLNAHENLITQAQRKESVLRLAKLISYKASRNLPARGLVKMSSIQTTESVIDSQGVNLAGRRINWNDNNNTDWKEQFLLIMNRVLEQPFGTVAPSERVQLDDVLFELYTWNNNPINSRGATVFSYSASANGESFPMEATPVALNASSIEEKRPEANAKFSLLYGADGLGDGSDTTGFFLFTKQGTMQKLERNFDGITPNQTFDLTATNVNETDIWLNHVEADSREILINDPNASTLPHLVADDLRYGEWVEVDLANAQNILFNTNSNRHKFETETLDEDQVRLIFGDGEFSDVPGGAFDIWYRISANSNTAIPRSAVVDQTASFTYTDATNNVQTLSFTFTLVNSLQNSSESEDIEHIRRVAPSVYYTQDRMVNGRDYNTFMLQDPSILKLRAVNRTFAGDSKYISWHDPKEYYENVKLFGDDLALYYDEQDPTTGGLELVPQPLSANELLSNVLEPLLSSTDFFQVIGGLLQKAGTDPSKIRRTFNTTPYSTTPSTNEVESITTELNNVVISMTTQPVDLYYSVLYDEWWVDAHKCDLGVDPGCTKGTSNSLWMIRAVAEYSGSELSGWVVTWRTKRQVAASEQTRFWNTNSTLDVLDFDTLNSNSDKIVVLQANATGNGGSLLSQNYNYDVLGQELVEQNLPNAGLPSIHKLSVIASDDNGDGVPDNLDQPDIFDYSVDEDYTVFIDSGYTRQLSAVPNDVLKLLNGKSYLETAGVDDDIIVKVNGVTYTFAGGHINYPSDTDANQIVHKEIQFLGVAGFPIPAAGDMVSVEVRDWVYFYREVSTDPWVPVLGTNEIQQLWAIDASDGVEDNYKRHNGRYPMNFAWFHYTERLHLVDPAASNIIDIYIIAVGYYLELTRWLENRIDNEPTAPTPLQLRNDYAVLLENKMISDTVVLHPGKFKILFGSRAPEELRCYFSVIRAVNTSLTDNEVKVRIVDVTRSFFDLSDWEFGETFFFTELAAAIHAELGPEIDSVVLVPTQSTNRFGDLFQVQSREDEIFAPDINTDMIEVVQSYTPDNIRQNG